MESGESVKKLPPHNGSRLKSISVSPDGAFAVIVLFDSTVTLWNLKTMELTEWLMRRAERNGVQVHSAAVNEVVMMADGKSAMTVSKDHTGRLWDLEANATVMILKGRILLKKIGHIGVCVGHDDGVDLIAVKDDGSSCMTAGYDRTARLWDLKTGECTMVLDHPKDIDFLIVDAMWQRAVTIAGEDTAWLWDIVKGRCLGILESQGDHLCGAVFSPDGRFLATYSSNSVVRVWTATSGKLRAVYLGDTGISACQFTGENEINTLVVGDGNGHVHFLEFPANELTSIRRKKHRE